MRARVLFTTNADSRRKRVSETFSLLAMTKLFTQNLYAKRRANKSIRWRQGNDSFILLCVKPNFSEAVSRHVISNVAFTNVAANTPIDELSILTPL
ncbi:MAG: hypothetical protein AVDCRST_MAG74-2223 [uncultured Pyrinomonadaceae bacterium]|uniref:Uncharacterized protein n=1 Tax=uncultured Pyrinomonadaceae bacterium TaxID=2283094 RepID=A0A6J4PD72_9BACT|nr:MAG: hypothetical protein AVDCRST_MAG74-2223 [uncultured Pyrinomonadaceae bacterium]